MTDVAQILGVSRKSEHQQTRGTGRSQQQQQHPLVPQGLQQLLGHAANDPRAVELPPIVPTTTTANTSNEKNNGKKSSIKVGNKLISTKTRARQWTYAPFCSSSRTDGLLLSHWVRAAVEYPDYPYARFDIHLDPVTYTDEEYKTLLSTTANTSSSDTNWTKSETDILMQLAKTFELRWAVIHDRWCEETDQSSRRVEELQHRYYFVAARLAQSHIAKEAAAEAQSLEKQQQQQQQQQTSSPEKQQQLLLETAAARALASGDPQHQPFMTSIGTGSSNKVFDLNYERERREYLEALWNRSKEDEEEELQLRNELKLVEVQLRKLKRSGRHVLAAAKGGGGGAAGGKNAVIGAGVGAASSRAATPLVADVATAIGMVSDSMASTAPVPTPGVPYLQSARLVTPTPGGPSGINKTLLTRMETVLAECKIPPRPIATKRVCDLYDTVRKDILALLILQKNALQKEGLVQSKRLQLAKMGGDVRVVDEETIMGIEKPPAKSTASTTTNTTAGTGATKTSKSSKKNKQSATAGGAAGSGGKSKSGKAKEGASSKSKDATGISSSSSPKAAAAAAVGSGTGTNTTTGATLKVGDTGKGAGGKGAKKPSAKRKRKSESKPVETLSLTANDNSKAAAATVNVPTEATSSGENKSPSKQKRAKKA